MKPYQDRKGELGEIFDRAVDMAGSFHPDYIEAYRSRYRQMQEQVNRELRALSLIESVLAEDMTAEAKLRMISHILVSECP